MVKFYPTNQTKEDLTDDIPSARGSDEEGEEKDIWFWHRNGASAYVTFTVLLGNFPDEYANIHPVTVIAMSMHRYRVCSQAIPVGAVPIPFACCHPP